MSLEDGEMKPEETEKDPHSLQASAAGSRWSTCRRDVSQASRGSRWSTLTSPPARHTATPAEDLQSSSVDVQGVNRRKRSV